MIILVEGDEITVTADPTAEPPQVEIAIALSGEGPLLDEVTIYRVDSNGRTPIRAGEPAVLSGGTWAGVDHELPLGEPVRYQAMGPGGRVVTSAEVTVDSPDLWLRHPAIPDLSVRLAKEVFRPGTDAQRVYGTSRGVFDIPARDRAVVVSSGVRRVGGFDLVLATLPALREQLTALLADESPVLIGCSPALGWDMPQVYVSVGDVIDNELWSFKPEPRRDWTLPCTVTDRPAGAVQAQWTLLLLGATWATVDDLGFNYDTVTDVGLDNRLDLTLPA